ncbi:MAG: hypothetical protein KDD44_02030 [Bdellovibrionales bacterium]|nr:hypothetical protein [Bdellovibrionales bacterium]
MNHKAEEYVRDATATVKEHPSASLAIATGIAAAIAGCAYAISKSRSSRTEQMMDRLNEYFDTDNFRSAYNDRRDAVREFVSDHPRASTLGVAGSAAALLAGLAYAASNRMETSDIMPRRHNFEDMTRDELYDVAREKDIIGRSAMSRTELLEAVR